MTEDNLTANAATPAADEPAAMFLKPDEAKILLDWADSEEKMASGAAGITRVRAIVKEIDVLVGNRLDLVADDLEERMIALLVGDLDPKSQINLEISRDVAQVPAEKDHLEGAELVRRLTEISSHTLRLTAGTMTALSPAATNAASGSPRPAAPASAPVTPDASPSAAAAVSQNAAARARPIPRPTRYPPAKPSLLQRLLGRK